MCSAVNSSPDDVFKHIMIMKIRRRNTTKKRNFFLIICRPSYITSSRSRESLRKFHIIFILLHALSLSLSLSLSLCDMRAWQSINLQWILFYWNHSNVIENKEDCNHAGFNWRLYSIHLQRGRHALQMSIKKIAQIMKQLNQS